MSSNTISIAEGRANLSGLIKRVKAGATVILTNHGNPEAVLSAYRSSAKPWRAPKPDDPARYGDLECPVMEEFS